MMEGMELRSMRKNKLSEYQAVILDMDGTLYYQKPFRRRMALWLLGHVLTHPAAFGELRTIMLYRRVREDWESYEKNTVYAKTQSLDERQYQYVAARRKKTPQQVEDTVRFYMLERPLLLLRPYRDDALASFIGQLRAAHKKVIIYSDYPVENKLKALAIEADACYASADERIGEMKPSPKGLQVIAKELGIAPQELVMVGDRYDKDGLAARACRMDYVILSADKKKRQKQEKELF